MGPQIGPPGFSHDQTSTTAVRGTSSNPLDIYRHVPRKPAAVNYDNLTREEAQKTFHGMLSDLGVGITWKWEDVNRVI